MDVRAFIVYLSLCLFSMPSKHKQSWNNSMKVQKQFLWNRSWAWARLRHSSYILKDQWRQALKNQQISPLADVDVSVAPSSKEPFSAIAVPVFTFTFMWNLVAASYLFWAGTAHVNLLSEVSWMGQKGFTLIVVENVLTIVLEAVCGTQKNNIVRKKNNTYRKTGRLIWGCFPSAATGAKMRAEGIMSLCNSHRIRGRKPWGL